MRDTRYQPLSTATIAARLGGLDVLADRVGPDSGAWSATEIGDGNLNLVFVLRGPRGGVTAPTSRRSPTPTCAPPARPARCGSDGG